MLLCRQYGERRLEGQRKRCVEVNADEAGGPLDAGGCDSPPQEYVNRR